MDMAVGISRRLEILMNIYYYEIDDDWGEGTLFNVIKVRWMECCLRDDEGW